MTSSVEECALCASSAHDVHHASVCVNVVNGVLVVHCELHVVVRVHVIPLVDVCDAVIDLTLVLIAHVVIVVFVVAIFQRILLYWRYTVYRRASPSSTNSPVLLEARRKFRRIRKQRTSFSVVTLSMMQSPGRGQGRNSHRVCQLHSHRPTGYGCFLESRAVQSQGNEAGNSLDEVPLGAAWHTE